MDYLLQEGDVLDKYCIERCLGAGGMGAVYLARHTQLNALRALKVLHTDIADDDPEFRERFAREARFAAKVQHPNIIAVMDVETESPSGFSYIVMEYVEGHSISQLLKNGPLPEAQAVFIIRETAKALAYAAESGIVHRDIKPANIMITTDGHVKLADLGIAKCDEASSEKVNNLTMAGTMIGTPAYASPEQCRDARSVDTRADIYSLGATLYEMLTGQSAFSGTNAFDIMAKVIRTNPVPVLQLNPEITPELAALVEKMMQKDPANRPQTMLDLLNEIYKFDISDVEVDMRPVLCQMIEKHTASTVLSPRASESAKKDKKKTSKGKYAILISVIVLLLIAFFCFILHYFGDRIDFFLWGVQTNEKQKDLEKEKMLQQRQALGLKEIEEGKKHGIKFSSNNKILLFYPGELSAENYVIPYGITKIAKDAFRSCNNIKRITIPDSTIQIGAFAFSGCSGLQDVFIPDSVKLIDSYAFYECENLEKITLPQGIKTIKIGTFGGCRRLKKIVIPDSVTKIGFSAFANCISLEEIIIPDKIADLGNCAFLGCVSLRSIVIPANVKNIPNECFSGCTNLLNVVMSENVVRIADGAFRDCAKLRSITIPSQTSIIGKNVFSGCNNLQQIIIPAHFSDLQVEAWGVSDSCKIIRR